jgi:hypothetical protein
MPAFDIDAWAARSGALDLSAFAREEPTLAPKAHIGSSYRVSGGQNGHGHH